MNSEQLTMSNEKGAMSIGYGVKGEEKIEKRIEERVRSSRRRRRASFYVYRIDIINVIPDRKTAITIDNGHGVTE